MAQIRLGDDIALIGDEGQYTIIDKNDNVLRSGYRKTPVIVVRLTAGEPPVAQVQLVDGSRRSDLPKQTGLQRTHLTMDGQAVIFQSSQADNTYDLVRWDLASQSALPLGNGMTGNYAVSPDGRSAVYSRKMTVDHDVIQNSDCCMSVDGQETRIADQGFGLAIADRGALVYYLAYPQGFDQPAELVVRRHGVDRVLRKNVALSQSHSDSIVFSADLLEVLFTDEGATWLCVDGAEPKKIADWQLRFPLVPRDTAWMVSGKHFILSGNVVQLQAELTVDIAGVSTLTDLLYYAEDLRQSTRRSLIWLHTDASTTVFDPYESPFALKHPALYKNLNWFLSSDGKNVVYQTDERTIVSRKAYRQPESKPTQGSVNKVKTVVATDDLSRIFCVDETSAGFILENGATRRVLSSVSSIESTGSGILVAGKPDQPFVAPGFPEVWRQTVPIHPNSVFYVGAAGEPQGLDNSVKRVERAGSGFVYVRQNADSAEDDDGYAYEVYWSADGRSFQRIDGIARKPLDKEGKAVG